MYTVKIKSIDKQKEQAIVQIVMVYENDQTLEVVEKVINMPYGFTKKMLREAVRNHVAMLENTDQVISELVLGTPFDYSKTQKEKDQEQLDTLIGDIDKSKRLVGLGVLNETDIATDLTTKRDEAKLLRDKLK